ncbi:MAG: methyl-accepting chemotaxis protein [Pseudanabaenaceae cyanobacterium bins.39]|nr:methyl-accepting chemotaxis protein [Pseudanabaenaceae cyanobacterium bins.39]
MKQDKDVLQTGTIMMTGQYQAALHSYAEGRYEEAMQQFSDLLYEDPRNPKLHIWLGATFRKVGKMEYAKVQYQQVLTLTDDPDLLDIASTSLAQIQNKLAKVSSGKDHRNNTHQPMSASSSKQDLHPDEAFLEVPVGAVGVAVHGSATTAKTNHYQVSPNDIESSINDETNDVTMLAEQPSEPKIKSPTPMNGNGKVNIPPPPSIAALAKEYGQEVVMGTESSTYQTDVSNIDHDAVTKPTSLTETSLTASSDITEKAPTSFLGQAIASLTKNVSPRSSAGSKGKKKKNTPKSRLEPQQSVSLKEVFNDVLHDPEPVASQPVVIDNPAPLPNESVVSSDVVIPEPSSPNEPIPFAEDGAVALEDLFKFSSIGQKLTLWGALIATIPAIAVGIATYQVGYGLLLNRAKQVQQTEAVSLAKATNLFLAQQASDMEVLKKLLASSNTNQNTLANRNAKGSASSNLSQQLNNRLALYKQIYPQYSQLALFSPNGNLLASSPNAKNLPPLNPNLLKTADSMNQAMFFSAVSGDKSSSGGSLYANIAIKDSASQKASMILLAEVPLSSLAKNLNAVRSLQGVSQFYLIDSNNKYIVSSQPIALGEDASVDFPMLSSLRSSPTEDLPSLVESDRRSQLMAYAPVPSMQSYGMTTWDLITTADKGDLIIGNQNLLFAVAIGIGVTPLLMAFISFLLSQRLSQRIREIRLALRDLLEGNFRNRIGLLIVEGNDELTDISISVNRMYEQFEFLMQKQEQEKKQLQSKVVKLFQVLAKLAREDKQEIQNINLEDLSDEKILQLGKKVRSEMIQHYAEVESYRQQKAQIKSQLKQMLLEMQALADGDLRISTNTVNEDLADVAIFFNDVLRGLQNIVSQVRSSANQVNFSLGQNEQAIANLASVSQRQVDIVSRSVNTLQVSVQSANTIISDSRKIVESTQVMSEKVTNSDQAIEAIVAKVAELQSTVANTAKRVKHLGEASQKISKAISFVNEIAIQTNFLAINASLEASRDQGKDFNFVSVAEEVGELANRSIIATKEVEGLLGHIQQETNAVMVAVETSSSQVLASTDLAIATRDNLQQIATIAQQIDGLMTSISEATSSQVQTSEGVVNLMQDISHIAQRTLSSSEDAAKFIKSTRNHTNDLQKSLAHFKI